ncbi:unnamed protein product [Rotaria magnacalcarata]|uniref:Uncharacterized protein n=1 Tax=Rotaria magnacalcarata TaxID=392030 RepID=A0A816NKA5_9BILA|nr:unnamed protein product [Rotaria magnacalcarata]
MIIIGYSGDAYSITRTFLGLNQRLNCILLDKRLHLLTDFLCIKIVDEIFESYHNSLQFQYVTQKLVTNNGLQDENQIIECLRLLVMFNIKNKYINVGNDFQLYGDRLQIIRQKLTHNELHKVDHDLAMALDSLKPSSKTIKKICSLIYERDARLEYNSNQLHIITAEKDRIDNHSDIFIQTTEVELLKILQDEYYLQIIIPWNENSKDSFTRALNRLFQMNYIDLILLIYRHNEILRTFFNTTDYIERNIDIMIGNRMRKQLLNTLIDEKPLALCFINRNFLLRLLDKKQFQILKKIIELSKSVLNLIDDDGNDLLLYLCLKVRGCRHRFIQYLIGISSNTQRINYHGQSLIDVLKLKENRSLLKKLIDHEIIDNVV